MVKWNIARMIVEEQGWWAAAFFITFIISTSFTFLNMFIAVFTNTMATVDIEDNDEHGMSKIYHDHDGRIIGNKIPVK